ncbi:MAG: PqqD family protein [Acidobacteriota bacterium]
MQRVEDSLPAVRVVINDDVLFRQLDDESVLLDLDSQRYFGLDEVGTRLWSLLQDDPNLHKARDVMLSEFDTDAATLDADLRDFLDELMSRGLARLETLDESSM